MALQIDPISRSARLERPLTIDGRPHRYAGRAAVGSPRPDLGAIWVVPDERAITT